MKSYAWIASAILIHIALLQTTSANTPHSPEIPKNALETRIVRASHALDVQGNIELSLHKLEDGRWLYQPWSQNSSAMKAHQDVCKSYGRDAATDVSVTLDQDVEFAFPCESKEWIANSSISPKAQGCHASAQMTGPTAVIQGVLDVFEGEALLEKDNRPGSVTGSLAVSVAGQCGTTIHAEILGGEGASRSLFLPIGCAIGSIGQYAALAVATVCNEWNTYDHPFTVLPN